jgi:hypothetical protein
VASWREVLLPRRRSEIWHAAPANAGARDRDRGGGCYLLLTPEQYRALDRLPGNPSGRNVAFCCIISWTMDCHEYVRLRLHYEASLRRWEQILLLPETPIGTPARLAAEIKQKALAERNAANERMSLHRQTCSVCNRHSYR